MCHLSKTFYFSLKFPLKIDLRQNPCQIVKMIISDSLGHVKIWKKMRKLDNSTLLKA